jgi:membrane protein implicated in regulation of membrane protease activity
MQAYVWWFVLGFGLVVAELMTGTFYLLVIAIALACAGVAAFVGAPLAAQLVIAAAIGLGGSIWLRKARFGKVHGRGLDPVQNMDIGQVVHIERWAPNRTARAAYRGAQWDVELAPGEAMQAGEFVIRDIQANRLIVVLRSPLRSPPRSPH